MDLYYEKNVINTKMRENPKSAKFYKGIRTACIVLIFIVVFYLFFRPLVFEIIFAYIILLAPPIGGIIFANQNLKSKFCEYDYIISSSDLKIVRIYNETKRVTIVKTEMINVERIGFTNTEEYNKLLNYPHLNKVMAFCNLNEQYLYIFASVDGQKSMILCEYDEEFIDTLKRAVKGYGVFADEIRKSKV